MLGLAVLGALALFGPELAPSDPHAQRLVVFYPDASFSIAPSPPDAYYPLGTDPLGRDQLSRLLWGARLTLTVVLLGLIGRSALAMGLGILGGWRGGWIDRVVIRVTDCVGGVPQLMLALLLVIVLQDHGIVGFALALALVGWPELARFVRAEVMRARSTPHVEAARMVGAADGRIVRTHVLRDLAPQLMGLAAMEAGSILLLLAELGFIGLFVAGGSYFVDEGGRPVLPVRDRAPEWGQMLAGARNYAFEQQFVAFVPGVVVGGTVLIFNLFAEGLRMAGDPFSARSLSPRMFSGFARAIGAGALIAGICFGYVILRSTSVTLEAGEAVAREAAHRVLPRSELVATAVRFSSVSYAMSRPEKLTYYYRDVRARLVRVSLVGGDANAMEVKLDGNEDELVAGELRPLNAASGKWELALRQAEQLDGTDFRNRNPEYLVRVVLVDQGEDSGLSFRVQYRSLTHRDRLDIRADVATGSISLPIDRLPREASVRARAELAGAVQLLRTGARWTAPNTDQKRAYGLDRPSQYYFEFIRSDISYPDVARVTLEAGFEGRGSVAAVARIGGIDPRQLPVSSLTITDLTNAVSAAREAGLSTLIDFWAAQGKTNWTLEAEPCRIQERQVPSAPATIRWDVLMRARWADPTGVDRRTQLLRFDLRDRSLSDGTACR